MNIEKSRGRNIVAMYIFSRNVYVNWSFLLFSNIQYFSNIYLSNIRHLDSSPNISNIIIENSCDFNFYGYRAFCVVRCILLSISVNGYHCKWIVVLKCLRLSAWILRPGDWSLNSCFPKYWLCDSEQVA